MDGCHASTFAIHLQTHLGVEEEGNLYLGVKLGWTEVGLRGGEVPGAEGWQGATEGETS